MVPRKFRGETRVTNVLDFIFKYESWMKGLIKEQIAILLKAKGYSKVVSLH